MGEISNKYVTIRAHIDGAPKEEDFEVITSSISTSIKPGSKDVVVKCLQIPVDPYQLNRMKSYSPSQNSIAIAAQIVPGQLINGFGVGRVVSSGHQEFEKDDLVAGHLGWAEYVVVKHGISLRKLDLMGFPLSYHVGILGISGLTAYGGFFQLCKPKKGEKVFVSSASGSVGNLVGQYAKLYGCYVVGCAGTKQKVVLLKEKLGFDEAFNYKEEGDLKLTLKRHFPDGIDIYFDNVGGEMLEAAIANMKPFGRVAACGAISQYTDTTRRLTGLDMVDIIYKRVTIQGFLSRDLIQHFEDFISKTSDHLHAGEMQVLEHISHGLESLPSAFVGLFRGCNIGKTIVQISDG